MKTVWRVGWSVWTPGNDYTPRSLTDIKREKFFERESQAAEFKHLLFHAFEILGFPLDPSAYTYMEELKLGDVK